MGRRETEDKVPAGFRRLRGPDVERETKGRVGMVARVIGVRLWWWGVVTYRVGDVGDY